MDWFIILIVIPFAIGFVGSIVKRSVLGPKPWPEEAYYRGGRAPWWQKVYFRSMLWHPVFVGLALGVAFRLFGGPIPDLLGESWTGCLLAGLFAAGSSIIGYQLIVRTIRRIMAQAGSLVGVDAGEDRWKQP